MNKDDVIADVEMSFKQIISLVDLLLENHCENVPNILTIRDLALSGLGKLPNLD